MENLPKDPFMLLSLINMKLRDQYDTLQALCDDMDIDREELVAKLEAAGFTYNLPANQFR